MYKGNNKTALASQKLIASALLSMLQKEKLSDICVSSLCKEANVSRQTFYSLFNSKEDVIIYALADQACYCPDGKYNLNDFANRYSSYLIENKKILKLLADNEILYCLENHQFLRFYNCPDFLPDATKQKRSYAACFIAGALSGITRNYIENDDCDLEELKKIIISLFKGTYFD